MRKRFWNLFVVLAFTASIGCGKGVGPSDFEESASALFEAQQVQAFAVTPGAGFDHAPPSIVIVRSAPSGAFTRKLVYQAPENGTFQLMASTIGVGTNCRSDSDQRVSLSYDFQVKDSANGSHSIQPEVKSDSDLHKVSLKKGNELLLNVRVQNTSDCRDLEIWLHAIFQ